MLKQPITKILFMDIESVGIEKDYDTCVVKRPEVAKQFINYYDWFLKRFPEEELVRENQQNRIFANRCALIPEFAKIVCVSFSFVLENGEIKTQSFYGDDEKEVLKNCQTLLNRCSKLDFFLCGHNLKNFDIPMLAKRMIINGLLPPALLPTYDTKPWEIKAIDTKEVWQYGSYSSIGSLDLLCSSLNIKSSKDGEITGDKVHQAYWEENRIDEIVKYCEKDVNVLIDVIIKLKDLK